MRNRSRVKPYDLFFRFSLPGSSRCTAFDEFAGELEPQAWAPARKLSPFGHSPLHRCFLDHTSTDQRPDYRETKWAKACAGQRMTGFGSQAQAL